MRAAIAALYHYGEHSWRFRVESSDDIEITGLQNVTRYQIMEVMGGDIGRNIFFVPLTERKAALEKIPWVESASVMRFVPNRLRIEIHERTPVAFARVGSKILLIDPVGTLMDLPAAGKKKYSFPVILGMNPGEPASTRAARMKIYNDLVSQLDAGGAHYSQDLSEVDLSDAEDVKVVASDPQGEVLVHLGSSNYLERYKVYVSHVREWRQQFDKLESVDLRYDRQIIVNPDLQGTVKQPPLSKSSAKVAMAAGMKPAALITHQVPPPKPHYRGSDLTTATKSWREENCQESTPQSDGESAVKTRHYIWANPKRGADESVFDADSIDAEHAGAEHVSSADNRENNSRTAGDRNRRDQTRKQTESGDCQGRGTSIGMANQQQNLLTAIDVGSAKTCVLVAEVTDSGLRYRGHGVSESRGSRKGVIVDLEKAVASIQKAVEQAEDVCGAPIEHALAGSGRFARSRDEQSRRAQPGHPGA